MKLWMIQAEAAARTSRAGLKPLFCGNLRLEDGREVLHDLREKSTN